MNSAAACVDRLRGARHAPVASRAVRGEAHVRRNLRRAAAGVTATLLVYGFLLTASVHAAPLAAADWTSSAAGRLRPYGVAVADGGAAFAHVAAQTLTWILVFAPLPLMVSVLLWPARRDQRIYERLAVALPLSGAAGLGVAAAERGWPVRETSLVHDYLAMTGVRAGWYVLMALAVVAATARVRPRAGVTLIALSAVVVAASTTDRPLLDALLAAVAPLLAWYASGRAVSWRPRARAPRPDVAGAVDVAEAAEVAPESVALRQAG